MGYVPARRDERGSKGSCWLTPRVRTWSREDELHVGVDVGSDDAVP
jgi:hypothetical protein